MSSRSLDLFFQACEVAGPPSLRVGGESLPRVMGFPFAVVGSDPGCDVVIDDPALSPRHCYMQVIGPKVLCIDLGSEHGVASDDGPAPACWVDPSHVARVGRQVIGIDGVAVGPDGADRTALPSVDLDDDAPLLARPLPRIALEFQTNAIRTRWRMRRPVALVGSAAGCAVRLNGPSVARYHCALVLTGQGLWAVDLLGRLEPPGVPGITVNGDLVRFARIDPGDVLGVGVFSVGVRYLPASPRKKQPAGRDHAVADMAGSGEIELAGKDRAGTLDARPSDGEVEALRRAYEDRIAELAVLHRDEVESLRNEIDDLNDLVEQLRAATPPKRRHSRRRGQNQAASPAPGAWPRKVSVRTLGTVRRSAALPAAIPAGRALDAAMAGPDLAAIDPVAGVPCQGPTPAVL